MLPFSHALQLDLDTQVEVGAPRAQGLDTAGITHKHARPRRNRLHIAQRQARCHAATEHPLGVEVQAAAAALSCH